nr:universal stress protein [Desulfobacula sp.]
MILPKIKIKKILFATDLSESARQSLAYAVSLSNLYGAGITIVHALEETQGMEAAIAYHVGPRPGPGSKETGGQRQKRHHRETAGR